MTANSNEKSTTTHKEDSDERRDYPRFKAGSLVQYLASDINEWCEAELVDYSASGACFRCDRALSPDTEITIHVMSNDMKSVPAMVVSATIVRCSNGESNRYEIACKFVDVMQEANPDHINNSQD